MRIAVLQYTPRLGDIQRNKATCYGLLRSLIREKAQVDLVIMPELALSGYNHSSRQAIEPYLEISGEGSSFEFAADLSRTLSASVVIGYPERSGDKCYNSAMIVNSKYQDGLLSNYRKKHLFSTDESWAHEGPSFCSIALPFRRAGALQTVTAAVGICMDLNPHQFLAPWDAYEFGHHVIESKATLVLVPMAWLKSSDDQDPLSTMKYWLRRLGPAWAERTNLVFVAANFTGSEGTAEYAGNSCVVAQIGGLLTILGKLDREDGLIDVKLGRFGINFE
ncbi:carbon-nitrogen hydrolase [Protomyces lactucae-debilis]|uniref:Carbon-nitrogen hydrolase n=1 Tax=Protomyces lactucae-debilis TaxID=2754530 RepID=A0A1Y2FUU6_PROLT|nr:carbon-nitrogen hydrolase [Protomyces lactucae-debilis]ORY87781.1 carbon-nitrogen hydrolase [Protomyces lactucae-debilis]